MKKFFLRTISAIFCIIFLPVYVGCGCNKNGEYTVVLPDGAPALAFFKLLADEPNFNTDKHFNYTVVSPSTLPVEIAQKNADIAVLPLNLATKIYKTGKGYKAVCVLTHGNFCFVSKTEIESLTALNGKIILVSQNAGSIPDLTLKKILTENGVKYREGRTAENGVCTLNYKGNAGNVTAELTTNADYIGLIAEPTASTFINNASGYKITELNAFCGGYPQAVIIIKNELIEKYPTIIKGLKTAVTKSIGEIETDVKKSINIIKQNYSSTTLNENISLDAIKRCNIEWKDVREEKQNVIDYITAIKKISTESIDDVKDEFFYTGEL